MPFLSRAGPGDDWSHQPHGVRGQGQLRPGNRAGPHRPPGPHKSKGKGSEGPAGASVTKLCSGALRRDQIQSSGGQGLGGGQADEMGPRCLQTSPWPGRWQGMRPGPLRQLRAGTSGAWGSPGGPALAPSSTLLSPGESPPRRGCLPPSRTTAPGLSPSLCAPGSSCPARVTPRVSAARSFRAGTALAPGLGEHRV